MGNDVLRTLLAGNRDHVESLPSDYFDGVRDAQRPDAVSICCSDSRVSQEGMWGIDASGELFTPSNVGNVVWDDYGPWSDGGDESGFGSDRTVDGSVLYPIAETGTRVAAVVGHTGCGAVTAARNLVVEGEAPAEPGIRARVELLAPVIEDGLAHDAVPTDGPAEAAIDRLVEYNVHRQAAFLRDAPSVPDSVDVYGFVYDLHGRYGDVPGRTYLVNDRGDPNPDAIAASLPDDYADHARSLLGDGFADPSADGG